MNDLHLWNAGLTIASIAGAAMWTWLAYFVKRELSRLDEVETELVEHRLSMAENFVTKADHRDVVSRLERRMDDGFDKIDRKLDTLFVRLDSKADKP